MRQKLVGAAFVALLLAAWGGGFWWVRGDLGLASDQPASRSAPASASPSPSARASAVEVSAAPVASPSARPSARPSAKRPADRKPRPKEERRRPRTVQPTVTPSAQLPVVTFSVASFNMLGSSHTRPDGHHPWLASGPQRIGGALAILDRHDVSVAGLQEFQPNQRAAFARQAVGWQQYPGSTLGGPAGENSVVWRTEVWELVTPGTVAIPYFNGRPRPMPYVLLRHRDTGIQAYFSSFHNPANTRVFRGQQRFRNAATSRQIALFNRLESTGVPQFVTGDMNERAEYFCRVTSSTPLVAAAGGSNEGRCLPPRRSQIDWIFGSPGAQFSGYGIDRSPLVRRTTDHPVVHATVTLDASKFENALQPGQVR